MTAAGEIFKTRDAGFDESLFNVAPNVSRRRAVKRQVTAFRADDHFVAREALVQSNHVKHCRSLVRFFENDSLRRCRLRLRPAQPRARRRRCSAIGFFVSVAEIRADADRRQPEILLLRK